MSWPRLRAVALVIAMGVFASASARAQETLQIAIRRKSVSLAVGDTTTLIAVVVVASQEAPASVTWSSDDGRVASVDRHGLVTARAAGIARITARLGTAFASTRVAVAGAVAPPPPPASSKP